MSDERYPHSGSRWEPASAPPAESTAAPSTAGSEQSATTAPSANEKTARFRGRRALAGAAVGLALVGGLSGFALGHATAGSGTDRIRPVGNEGTVGNVREHDSVGRPYGFDDDHGHEDDDHGHECDDDNDDADGDDLTPRSGDGGATGSGAVPNGSQPTSGSR